MIELSCKQSCIELINEPSDVLYSQMSVDFWCNIEFLAHETRIFLPDTGRFELKMNVLRLVCVLQKSHILIPELSYIAIHNNEVIRC